MERYKLSLRPKGEENYKQFTDERALQLTFHASNQKHVRPSNISVVSPPLYFGMCICK